MKNRNFIGGKSFVRHADPKHTANYHSAEDLENEANQLSNFNGGMLGYTGAGDDFLDYAGGAVSLASAHKNAKPFIMTITNANTSPRTALLCPGLDDATVGLVTDGAFNDKAGAAGLSALSGSPGSIKSFQKFIRLFPSVISGFKIATSNIAQMDQSVTLVKESPFAQHSSKVITPGTWASEGNFNTAILTIPESFFMDAQTRIEYPILGSTSVVITLMVGVSLNIAKALRSKAEKAKVNIEAAGGPAVVSKFIG
ncbi:hypothetical protein [Nubsella zeaxanthinifaciens]|uniref:hypothetical protein n=1 Tax=Nubsella zeaxanthinifaciens TaxID=392412 RepID=UPI000DE343E1|nr:hypothetical protein [Nubsella zeaxanthinifaciens]